MDIAFVTNRFHYIWCYSLRTCSSTQVTLLNGVGACVRLQFVTPYHSSLYFNTRIRVGIHIIVVDIVKQHLPCRRLEGLVLHRSTDIIGSKSFQYSTTLSTNPTYLTNVVRKGVEEVL